MKKYTHIAMMLSRFIAFLVICISTPAYALHPCVTDDTGTQGKGALEIEFCYQYEHDRYRWFDRTPESIMQGIWGSVYTKNSLNEAGLGLSYGIINPLDIVIGVPYAHCQTSEGRIYYNPPVPMSGLQGLYNKSTTVDSGIVDPFVELKWRFYAYKGLSFAIKPGAYLPLGNEDIGFGSGRFRPYLFFVMTFETEYLNFHLNLGYIRNENNQNEIQNLFHGTIAMEVVMVKDLLKFVVNTGLNNMNICSKPQDVFVLGGLVFSPSDICDIDVGFKYSIPPMKGESPGGDYAALAGFTIRFEGGEKLKEDAKG